MASKKQIAANQVNAQKSTGPTSAAGKQKVSQNRLSHGIFSGSLLLESECPEDFNKLLDGLVDQLRPVGALEFSLVDRITVAIWRQRRLISAETAATKMASNDKQVARGVESALGLSSYVGDAVTPDDLRPPSKESAELLIWCRTVIQEIDALEELSVSLIKRSAPLVLAQLESDAESEDLSIADYLKTTKLGEYVDDLVTWCQKEAMEIENQIARYPSIAAAAETSRQHLSIPWGKVELLNKYQTALEDQLYKAMRALKDAQEWRLASIDTINVRDDDQRAAAA